MELRINDRIRTRKVKFFNGYTLSLRFDSVASSFGFNGYYNSKNQEHIDLYCIGHYHIVYLEHNGELILTGNITNEKFNDQEKEELVGFSGYSKAGVLEDCTIPPTLYPLQNDNLSLREIASRLIAPFGIKMIVHGVVNAAMDEPYEKTTAEPTQKIKDYLMELAAQKDIVISHNANGDLVFTKAQTGQLPILRFNKNKKESIPFDKMELEYEGQGMHSHIYAIKQASKDGGNAGEFEIINPFVINTVYRPLTIVQSSGTDNDTEKVARQALAAELKNLRIKITTDRWEVDGKIIKPNSIVSVVNPDVYLFKETKLFVEQIDFVGDPERTVATLTCCLPEVYNGQVPKYLWAGINLH